MMQGIEAAVNLLIVVGAAVLFLTTLEGRAKRNAALADLHQLRSIVHVIDMHQLTKDPGGVLHPGGDTASSPKRITNALRSRALPRLLLGDAVAVEQGGGALCAERDRSAGDRRGQRVGAPDHQPVAEDLAEDQHRRAPPRAARTCLAGTGGGESSGSYRASRSLLIGAHSMSGLDARNPVELTQALIRCPSVTPAEAGALTPHREHSASRRGLPAIASS